VRSGWLVRGIYIVNDGERIPPRGTSTEIFSAEEKALPTRT